MNVHQIGRMFDCSGSWIATILRENGVVMRTTSEAVKIMRNDPAVAAKRRKTYKDKNIPSSVKGKTWKLGYVRDGSKIQGANNPQWKGGKTKLSISIRTMPEYSLWRKAIFQRDNYKCVFCGDQNQAGHKVIIQGDHIVPLSQLIEQHQIKNIDDARKCAAIWDLTNGRTLCKKCHKNTPTYGCNIHRKAN